MTKTFIDCHGGTFVTILIRSLSAPRPRFDPKFIFKCVRLMVTWFTGAPMDLPWLNIISYSLINKCEKYAITVQHLNKLYYRCATALSKPLKAVFVQEGGASSRFSCQFTRHRRLVSFYTHVIVASQAARSVSFVLCYEIKAASLFTVRQSSLATNFRKKIMFSSTDRTRVLRFLWATSSCIQLDSVFLTPCQTYGWYKGVNEQSDSDHRFKGNDHFSTSFRHDRNVD